MEEEAGLPPDVESERLEGRFGWEEEGFRILEE